MPSSRLAAHRSPPLPKLLQKPHISLKKMLQIIHAVLQHGDAVGAHTEGESGNFLRIVSTLFYELEHIRIDHATAQNFDPSCLLAGTARIISALAAPTAYEAADIHFRAGLREWKE